MSGSSRKQWTGLNVTALRKVGGHATAGSSPYDENVAMPSLRGFEGVGPHAGAVLAAIAVLGPDALLSRTTQVAELSLQDTLAAVDLLTSAGLVANSMPLCFRDDDTAERVLAGVSVSRIIAMRLRAAEQLRGIPGAAERVADQLVRIGPIGLDWAAEALCVAATQAMDSGNWQTAAEWLRHALAESLPAQQRMEISRQLATVLAPRDPLGAVTCLLQELRMHDTPVQVVETTRLLRRLATWLPNTPDVSRLFEEAADHLHHHDPAQAVRLQLTRTSFTMFAPEGAVLLRKLEGWLTASDLTDPQTSRALDATRACLASLHEPKGGNAVELATSVLATANHRQEWDTCWLALSALVVTGDDEVTWEACRTLDATLPATGAEIQRSGCDLARGLLYRRQGDLPSTVSALRRVLTSCLAFGLASNHSVVATAAANLAEALVRMGEVKSASELLTEHGLLNEVSHASYSMCLLRGRGAVAAATGDLEQALADQLDCGRVVTAWAELNIDFLPWRLDAVRTMLRLGKHADADALAQAEQAAARAWGSSRSHGFAAHALALTTEGPRRAELLAEAIESFRECGAKLAESDARHNLGAALRGAGQDEEAANQIALARELAVRCGAALPDAQSDASLQDVPAEPASEAESVLTSQERRIARLVNQGLSNAEVAEELALARRTVEFHLSGVYRKLGISGRRELATWAGDGHL